MKESDKTWCPAIEFNETNKDLILKAEIPGVEIKNLNIHAEPESILISGDRPKQLASHHTHHELYQEQELIKPTDDDYPATGEQPFHGDRNQNNKQYY